jgi:hypothetical protein
MGKSGINAALMYGDLLPSFRNQQRAEKYFYSYIEKHLKLLGKLSKKTKEFDMDYTPESLKRIELWYFQLYLGKKFAEISANRQKFERCINVYFGEVVVRNIQGASWVVEEYSFMPGKYEFGVNKDNLTISLIRWFSNLHKYPNNKRKQSIYRRYKKYFFIKD